MAVITAAQRRPAPAPGEAGCHQHGQGADRRGWVEQRPDHRHRGCQARPTSDQQVHRQQDDRLVEGPGMAAAEPKHVHGQQEHRCADPGGRHPVGMLAHDPEHEQGGQRRDHQREPRSERDRVDQVAGGVVDAAQAERHVAVGDHGVREWIVEQPGVLEAAHPERMQLRVRLEGERLKQDLPLGPKREQQRCADHGDRLVAGPPNRQPRRVPAELREERGQAGRASTSTTSPSQPTGTRGSTTPVRRCAARPSAP